MHIPEIVKLEVTNRCNARCVFCSHRQLDPETLGDMPFQMVKRLVYEASGWNPRPKIQFSGFGEPTLYPYLVQAVRYARAKGLRCYIYTNGQLMTPDLTRRLVKAGLTWFLITVDARDKATYEKIRVGLDFDTVSNNIEAAWKICRNSHTKMRLGSVICPENRSDIPGIKRHWRRYAHKYEVWGEIPLIKDRVPQLYKRCRGKPWTQLLVRVNGDVPFCCIDVADEYTTMGNVKKAKMLWIYNSPGFNVLRRRVKSLRNIPRMCTLVCLKG